MEIHCVLFERRTEFLNNITSCSLVIAAEKLSNAIGLTRKQRYASK
jgi:hypothetical protein